MIKRATFLFLIFFVYSFAQLKINVVTGSETTDNSLDQITIKVLEQFSSDLDQMSGKLLVLIVPDESGKFILDSLNQINEDPEGNLIYEEINSLSVEEALNNNLKNKALCKYIILQIGPKVSYQYLYNNFIRKINNFLTEHYTEEEINEYFEFQLHEPWVGDEKNK